MHYGSAFDGTRRRGDSYHERERGGPASHAALEPVVVGRSPSGLHGLRPTARPADDARAGTLCVAGLGDGVAVDGWNCAAASQGRTPGTEVVASLSVGRTCL